MRLPDGMTQNSEYIKYLQDYIDSFDGKLDVEITCYTDNPEIYPNEPIFQTIVMYDVKRITIDNMTGEICIHTGYTYESFNPDFIDILVF